MLKIVLSALNSKSFQSLRECLKSPPHWLRQRTWGKRGMLSSSWDKLGLACPQEGGAERRRARREVGAAGGDSGSVTPLVRQEAQKGLHLPDDREKKEK